MAGHKKYFNFLTFFGILFIIQTHTTVEAFGKLLEGSLQSCSNEGEEIPIESILQSKCYKCICQNGFVKCEAESCPVIDDCYVLDKKTPGSCCLKCKECVYKGIRYQSGFEWSDPDDPCINFKCVAGVVTETTMQCYTQCDESHLLAPRPGQCCPTCLGCRINGQIVHEGREVSPIDDPCLVCSCSNKKLMCVKKACPVLQCPITKQIRIPGECCPKCRDRREIYEVQGTCFFEQKLHSNMKNFIPDGDRCSNCTCISGTSICRRSTCPVLECQPEYQIHDDGCCPRCMTSEFKSECIHNGTTYQNEEEWQLTPCRSCTCRAGVIRCAQMKCPKVKCRPNEILETPHGECCAKCVETAGTCTVFGDPHFKTFDGKFFSFQGSCKYQLTADCRDHSFSVRLTSDGRGTKRSSWTKTVTLKLRGGYRVNLGQKLRVKVNGTRVILPFSNGPITSIERLPDGILLKTDLGIQIEWDGNNFLQIQVPVTYKGKLCGLCGNYNGIVRDDLTSRDGTNHSDQESWRFANSWKVGGNKSCSRPKDYIASKPTCNFRKQRIRNKLCRPLLDSSIFGDCGNKLNPENYFESCKMDLCECPNGLCFCDSFAAYAHECKRLGVLLPDWRNSTNCPIGGLKKSQYQQLLKNNVSLDNSLRNHERRRSKSTPSVQEFLNKHIPKALQVFNAPNRTPPPLH